MDRDAGGAALKLVDGNGKRGSEHRCVVLHLMGQAQFGRARQGKRHAEYAAGVLQHEVDLLGRDFLCGDYNVALVFAVFVVDYYQHFAGLEIGDGFLDGIEFYFSFHFRYSSLIIQLQN